MVLARVDIRPSAEVVCMDSPSSRRRTLVTGGAGYIGQVVVTGGSGSSAPLYQSQNGCECY